MLCIHRCYVITAYARHTGKLECFNSLILSYAPKRVAFQYDVYNLNR